jgi:hypothetical protein
VDSIDGIETLTLPDKASVLSNATKKLKAIRTQQQKNVTQRMKLAEDGIYDPKSMAAMAKDDTANGFGVENGDRYATIIAEAAAEHARVEDIKREWKHIEDVDEWKSLSKELGEGYFAPEAFDGKVFMDKVHGSKLSPIAKNRLMWQAMAVDAANERSQTEAGTLWDKREVPEAESSAIANVKLFTSDVMRAYPQYSEDLYENMQQIESRIRTESDKPEGEQDWEAFEREVKSEGILGALTK